MTELISVIIPAFNTEKYLDRCIESVVNQSYNNLEIIIVDDGSTDNTPELCDKWAERDNRITVLHTDNNGVSNARIMGINASNGKYIGFIDSDDFIDPHMYEELHKLLISSDSDIACCKYFLTKESKFTPDSSEESIKYYDYCGIIKNIYNECLWSLWSKLFRRELFEKAEIKPYDITVAEDMLLNYSLFKNCSKLVTTSRKYYYYFRHSNSVMSGRLNARKINDSLRAYQIIDEEFDKNSPAYPYQVANMLSNDFGLIMQIIRTDSCRECYEKIRQEILEHKKYAFMKCNNSILNKGHQLGIILLGTFPRLFDLLIKIKS